MRALARSQTSLARPATSTVRVARMCDTCRSDEETQVQRAIDPAAATDHHFAQLAVAPPAASGEIVEVSEPDDASERDADRMAEQALSGAADAPVAPSAGGQARLARAMDEEAAPESPSAGGFVVDDDAATLLPGQMRKGAFLKALREDACAAANRELARAGRSTEGCPYLARWFDYYEQRDARHVERAVRKYAPDAAQVTSAAGYIPIVSARAAQAARQWAETGALPEMPEGMGAEMMGGGLLGAIGGAIGGALSAIGGLLFKAERGGARGGVDRGALESRLGPGQPLDGGAQSRMGAAFGHDFSRVRVHADREAGQAASALNARAFTLGNHIAFAAGQYRPGDVVGDALLAHELAHVIQQRGAGVDRDPAPADAGLEADADAAAEGALVGLWGREHGLDRNARDARPRLASGLRLQRCNFGPPKQVESAPLFPERSSDVPLNDQERKLYEQFVVEGMDKLARGGCKFPSAGQDWRYDDRYFVPVDETVPAVAGRSMSRGLHGHKYRPKETPGMTPARAIDLLFGHLDKWDFDCAMYSQVATIYGFRHALGDAKFNQRFADLAIRTQSSPGIAEETLGFEDTPDFDRRWTAAPVGSTMVWEYNHPAAEGSAFHYENTKKRRKGATDADARYDAMGLGVGESAVGTDLTEDEVKWRLALQCARCNVPGVEFRIDRTWTRALQGEEPALAPLVAALDALPTKVYLDMDAYVAAIKPLIAQHVPSAERDRIGNHLITRARIDPRPGDPRTLEFIRKYIRRFQIVIPGQRPPAST